MRRVWLILAIAVLAISVYLNVILIYARYGLALWWLLLLNLLPGLILLGAYKNAATLRPIAGLVVRLVGFSVLLLTIITINRLVRNITPVTKSGCYESILRETRSAHENWVSHFPAQLPRSARNARLYYSPAFLMGGGSFELRFEASDNDVRAVIRRFRLSSKAVIVKSETARTNNAVSHEFRNTSNRGWSPLPGDFRIFVMSGRRYYPGGGDTVADCGVAISEHRNEIIYWAGM